MNRTQLEHILRASAAITGADEFVVIGSQSILGAHPDAPSELLVSMEADLFTFRSPADADLVEGSIGEGSPFHHTFGYCAHGVGIETAKLPQGWQQRLIAVASAATGGATGLCLEPHDLAISKLIAGREKDLEFVRDLLRHAMVDPKTLAERLAQTEIPQAIAELAQQRLRRACES
jgi:hypothetical protein